VNKKRLSLLAVLLFCWPFFALARTVHITHFRITRHQSKWRLVFTADAPLRYHQFRLTKPPRLVFDIRHARFNTRIYWKRLKQSPIRNIRTAVKSNGTLRLVLDLKAFTKIRAFTLNPSAGKGYRLVIDITGKKLTHAPRTITPILTVLSKPKRPPRNVIIVIDPGHGGKDPGATGLRGTHEKNIVLDISKQLQRIINQQPG